MTDACKSNDSLNKTVHDLLNVLMVISGNAQLCLLEEIRDENIVKNLKIIIEQAERAKKILDEISSSVKQQ